MGAMTDDLNSPRRPFGDRGSNTKQPPFGARAPGEPPRREVYTPPADPADTPAEGSNGTEPASSPASAPLSVEEAEPPAHLRPWNLRRLRPLRAEDEDEQVEDLDDEEYEEPFIQDEPEDVPPVVAVRSRRGSIASEDSILKKSPTREDDTPEFQSYPEAEAAVEAEKQAEYKRQVVIRFGVVLRAIALIFGFSAVVATLFTWWTPNAFMPDESVDQLALALATQSSVAERPLVTFVPTLTPVNGLAAGAPNSLGRIGIVSGHRGLHPSTGLPDPGAVCADGLTEQQVVGSVADQVARLLTEYGYTVDVFDEFDSRLAGYQALAMVSIHADSCEFINELATGFKVASFSRSSAPEQDSKLVGCLITRYEQTTGLAFHPNTVTRDMTEYHNFAEISPSTPGAIIEIGFMYLDREMLTAHTDVVALGIGRGLLCYLRNEPLAEPPPEPSGEPPAGDTQEAPTRVP